MYSKSDIEYIEKTVTWNWYVDLLTAKSWSLSNLTLFWWTTQDDTDVLQSVVLDWATVQRNVPEWYTELDYIRNVISSTKFNTWLSPQNWDVLELVRTAWTPTVSNYMFQSREWTQAWIYGISWSSSWWTIMWNRWSWQSLQSEILRTNGHKYYTKMSVIWTTLTLTVKDLTDKLENTKTREITETAWWPSRYFLRWNATQQQALWTAQSVYFARISNGWVDRIRLIPAKQWDTVWFYDMVSQTFMSTFVGDTPIASTAEASAHPFAPMNIVWNNWTIKVHKNLIDKSTVVRWDISSDTWAITTWVLYRAVSDFIPILNWQTYSFSWRIKMEWDETRYNASKPIVALYDSSKNYISWTRALQNTYTFTIDNASASYIRVEWWWSPSWTSVVDLQNSEFQFQVWPNVTAYEEWSWIYIEWETETVQDALWNTATAELLLSSSTYVDTQEVLTWLVTRNTEVLVLDWTEDREIYSWWDYPYFRCKTTNAVNTTVFLCTHFPSVALTPSDTNQWIRVQWNYVILRFDSICTATAENIPVLKKWLSDEYAEWTPVILIKKLNTALTETVEWQELVTKPITQTAWSISNMTITVTSDWWIPTPSTPKDIICNNGVLKCSKNLLNLEDLEWSYLLTDSWQRWSSNDSWFLTNFIKVKPSTSYVFDFISWWDYVYRRICWYSSNDYNTFTELLIKKQRPTTENERYSLQFTTWATTNYIKISSHRFDTNIQLIEWTEAIPYRNYLEVYTEWTIETVKDSWNRTATAEILVKIKDLADEQEVLSWNITRKNKILVLDWTESRTESWTSWSDDHRFMIKVNANNKAEFSVCTHISRILRSSTTIQSTRPCIRFSQDWINLFRYSADNTQTLADFQQRLAEQYENWTPVIVVFPLATETTETVDWQNLNVKSWTNKIEIVQASIDNLWISATYLSRE